ncbi:MAG: glycerophosphodiester phosphodiesterase [Asticcacaulis sp.]
MASASPVMAQTRTHVVQTKGAEASASPFLVIAHRGASGERPEHTESAYLRAIAQGAAFIEPDLVATKDGHLVARHENLINDTTDVAGRPEFASRKTTKVIDGERYAGWFTEDFTLAELKTLRTRERMPQLRPANTAFDGQDVILTLEEVIALAKRESARTGRVIGIYPELKHPSYFNGLGLKVEDALVSALEKAGWTGADAPVFVQCFEVTPLQRLSRRIRTPLVQLVAAEAGPADLPGTTYAQMLTPDGLKAIATYAQGLGPDKTLILPRDVTGKATGAVTDLVARAHALGLKVHPWTLRLENAALSTDLRRGDPKAADYLRQHGDWQAELSALRAAKIDGIFTDFPAQTVEAVKARP